VKILYDHQIFTTQKFGGISRYFTQIISNLPNNILPEISIEYSDNVYLKTLSEYNHLPGMNDNFNIFFFGISFRGKRRIYNLLRDINPDKYPDSWTANIQKSIYCLKKQDFDVFHPTYYDDYFLEYIGNKPFVLTIHDMIHELYPELLNDSSLSMRKKKLAEKAAYIIAVSENTKKDIINILNIPEEKITVVYHASPLLKNQVKIQRLPSKYFLFVGARNAYKNFAFFVYAIAPVLKEQRDIHVVCTGNKFNQDEIQIFKDLDVEANFTNVFVDEDEWFEIYNNAIALIFPSYYEGFGIPILEAFEASCPVLLSNSSCFFEIAQDAAVYFSPKNIKQLRKQIKAIIDNSILRQDLIYKGKSRVLDFTWQKSANQTSEIYNRVLKNE